MSKKRKRVPKTARWWETVPVQVVADPNVPQGHVYVLNGNLFGIDRSADPVRLAGQRAVPMTRATLESSAQILRSLYPPSSLREMAYDAYETHSITHWDFTQHVIRDRPADYHSPLCRCCQDPTHEDCVASHELALQCGTWTQERLADLKDAAFVSVRWWRNT